MSETVEIKKLTAQDLILFIGLPCAIYDLLPNGEINKDVVAPAYIEGVDVHLNKIIAERVSYEPAQIKPILKRLEELTMSDTVFISCDIMGYNNEPDKHGGWPTAPVQRLRDSDCPPHTSPRTSTATW